MQNCLCAPLPLISLLLNVRLLAKHVASAPWLWYSITGVRASSFKIHHFCKLILTPMLAQRDGKQHFKLKHKDSAEEYPSPGESLSFSDVIWPRQVIISSCYAFIVLHACCSGFFFPACLGSPSTTGHFCDWPWPMQLCLVTLHLLCAQCL